MKNTKRIFFLNVGGTADVISVWEDWLAGGLQEAWSDLYWIISNMNNFLQWIITLVTCTEIKSNQVTTQTHGPC